MFKDKKITMTIIVVLMISVIGLGIAFAAFSQTLTINGSGTVESSSWSVVFEGADGSNTIGAPTLVGTATEVTHPTIKNNSTEISTYEVTLKSPGDSITYNFKIHNKGDYAANLTSLTLAGVNRPGSSVRGTTLTTKTISSNNSSVINQVFYSFFYVEDNSLVGQNPGRDCLEPGESVNVSLKLNFNLYSWMDSNYLPKNDIILDNLGVSATYTQADNGSCAHEPGMPVVNVSFENIVYAYYTYEGKSFIGTGIDNLIIAENITSMAQYASYWATKCSDGSTPTGSSQLNKKCPEGTTYIFEDSPAADAANAYCTGCRLMTHAEACAWGGASTSTCTGQPPNIDKIIAKYNGSADFWYLADAEDNSRAWLVSTDGFISSGYVVFPKGVRPVVSISSTATMTGSGTSTSPYVITQ